MLAAAKRNSFELSKCSKLKTLFFFFSPTSTILSCSDFPVILRRIGVRRTTHSLFSAPQKSHDKEWVRYWGWAIAMRRAMSVAQLQIKVHVMSLLRYDELVGHGRVRIVAHYHHLTLLPAACRSMRRLVNVQADHAATETHGGQGFNAYARPPLYFAEAGLMCFASSISST